MIASRREFIGSALALCASGAHAQGIPGGHYLSFTSADDPIVTSDAVTSNVWLTPHYGESNATYHWDGSQFSVTRLPQLQLALSSSVHLADTVYPVFLINPAGTDLIATGPALSNSGYGSTSAVALAHDGVTGLLVNANSVSMYSNGTTYTVPAGRGRFIGGIRPYANGAVRKDVSAGSNRRCDIWNLHNRRKVKLIVTETGFLDTTISPPTWHWYTTQIAPRNLYGNANCYADVFTLSPQRVEAAYFQAFFPGYPYGVNYDTGIRWNSEVSSSGAQHWRGAIGVGGRWESHAVECKATIEGAFGLNKVAPCETVESFYPGQSSGSCEVFGQEFCCRCSVEFDG